MTKFEKLLIKAIQAPGNLAFSDLETLLQQHGWVFKRQTGSHRFWMAPDGTVVPLQPKGHQAKEYQVKQVLRIMEKSHARSL